MDEQVIESMSLIELIEAMQAAIPPDRPPISDDMIILLKHVRRLRRGMMMDMLWDVLPDELEMLSQNELAELKAEYLRYYADDDVA